MSFAEQLAARAAAKNAAMAAGGGGGDASTSTSSLADSIKNRASSSSVPSSPSSRQIATSKQIPVGPVPKLNRPQDALPESDGPKSPAAATEGSSSSEEDRPDDTTPPRGNRSKISPSSVGVALSKQKQNKQSRQKKLHGSSVHDGSSGSVISASSGISSSGLDYKEKAEKYKSENKKLRKEALLLRAKLEVQDIKNQNSSDDEDTVSSSKLTSENEELRGSVEGLKRRCRELELKLAEGEGKAGGKEISEKTGEVLRKLRKSREDLIKRSEKASEMSRGELAEENVRLTRLLLDIGDLDDRGELRKIGGGDGDDKEKDGTIQQLKSKLSQTESELAEVTELKNAEIDVLRKQLNRAESKQPTGEQSLKEASEVREKIWDEEREGLREEIRRLNLEISQLKEKYRHRSSLKEEEQEADDVTSMYRRGDSNGEGKAMQYSENLDDNDVASLESIIAMMRQTIDQCNKEKDLLETRLTEEQERSQMELKAFARTLEGVDELRKSAEVMSREIRRIKVKGYRPTQSDLLGRAGTLEGSRNFGELTAAVEASESMEEAIRLIESQNDAMEERRRMGVVASRAATASAMAPAGGGTERSRQRVIGLSPIPDDREGGFLSFWNGANGEDPVKKDEQAKKKKAKRKKKRDEGSVLTSFF